MVESVTDVDVVAVVIVTVVLSSSVETTSTSELDDSVLTPSLIKVTLLFPGALELSTMATDFGPPPFSERPIMNEGWCTYLLMNGWSLVHVLQMKSSKSSPCGV